MQKLFTVPSTIHAINNNHNYRKLAKINNTQNSLIIQSPPLKKKSSPACPWYRRYDPKILFQTTFFFKAQASKKENHNTSPHKSTTLNYHKNLKKNTKKKPFLHKTQKKGIQNLQPFSTLAGFAMWQKKQKKKSIQLPVESRHPVDENIRSLVVSRRPYSGSNFRNDRREIEISEFADNSRKKS